MKRGTGIILAAMATVAAAQGVAQTGAAQVIARVGSESITRAGLLAELPGGVTNHLLEIVGLQALISRKLLVQEARHQKLDKTPVGAMLLKRAEETTLAGLLEQQFAGKPPVITDQEVRAFVAGNPLMFSGRRLVTLDQFTTSESNVDLAKRMGPANSMGEFEDVLLHDHVPYQRSAKVLDTLTIDAKGAASIAAMQPGQVFITPRGVSGLEMSSVTENRAVPITGTQAESMARVLLTQRALETRVRAAEERVVKAGQADVRINPDYEQK